MAVTVAQRLCAQLEKNDCHFTELSIDLSTVNHDEMTLIVESLEKNSTVTAVHIENCSSSTRRTLTTRVALALAGALAKHPSVNKLSIRGVHIIEFSAIALAFHQNDRLKHLSLSKISWSVGLNGCLRSLLAANVLVTLHICRVSSSGLHENPIIDISGALRHNNSLVDLWLSQDDDDEEQVFSPGTIRDIPHWIRANRGIKNLSLSSTPIDASTMMLIASGIEHHPSLEWLSLRCCQENMNTGVAEGLALMMENAPSLASLSISCPIELGVLRQLVVGLRSAKSALRELLICCQFGSDGAACLARELMANRTLEVLTLHSNDIGDEGALAIASVLENGTTLKKLHLWKNNIGSEGAAALARVIRSNRSLVELDIQSNPLGDSGTRSFVQMLTENTSLKKLCISCPSKPAMDTIVESLPRMSLASLDLSCYAPYFFTKDAGNAILQALERNTILEHLILNDGGSEYLREIRPKIVHLLELNRGGRRILTARGVPQGLWPQILGRSSHKKDVLYFFLREKPDVLASKGGIRGRSRKRKRDQIETSVEM